MSFFQCGTLNYQQPQLFFLPLFTRPPTDLLFLGRDSRRGQPLRFFPTFPVTRLPFFSALSSSLPTESVVVLRPVSFSTAPLFPSSFPRLGFRLRFQIAGFLSSSSQPPFVRLTSPPYSQLLLRFVLGNPCVCWIFSIAPFALGPLGFPFHMHPNPASALIICFAQPGLFQNLFS